MSIKVFPKSLNGHVHVIGSKSYAHRALIAASLAEGLSVIKNYPPSDDVFATKRALESFGIRIDDVHVYGGKWKYNQTPIDCMASGSTLRFMIPLAMLQHETIVFNGVKRLFERPLDVYEHIFKNQRFDLNQDKLIVKGPITSNTFEVDGSKSSQFLTGLLFALPLLTHDSTIILTKPLQSASYISITLDILKLAGITIMQQDHGYVIPGNQLYQPIHYEVEGDYSQAAFFMVAATIGGTISLSNLKMNSKQGDKKIVDIIKSMGGNIEFNPNNQEWIIQKSQTNGIEIDLEDIPDLGPILMILAAVSKGVTVFKHIERLRYKESDRLQVMLDILEKVGVSYELTQDQVAINGIEQLKGGQSFETYGDHRIAMALAVMSSRVDQPITILNHHVVSKSYPNFFEVFKSLGGYYENN